MNQATFKHVKREVFNAVSDRIRANDSLYARSTVCYNGTNLYGDITIEVQGGYLEEYKKVLQIFNEEFCR